jgi:hypothetical protein
MVFRFIAGIIIRLIGLWGYYILLIGLALIICLRFSYRAYKNGSYETVFLIVCFFLIIVGGIIALVNS